MLWKGLGCPAAETLPIFSCPCPELPARYPIKSSSSSSAFLRPQILHATTKRPARIAAPPIPTTTPMTVFFVFGLIPEVEAVPSPESWPLAPVGVEVDVDEETEVIRFPDTVITDVINTTLSDVGVF